MVTSRRREGVLRDGDRAAPSGALRTVTVGPSASGRELPGTCLARPGGNVSGLSVQFTDLAGKRLELFREVIPGLRRLAIMANVASPSAVLEMREAQITARALGLEITSSEIHRAEDIAPAFEANSVRPLSHRC
jgi:ABC-type uncharacterized transport system substrate-binding protein